MRITGMSGLLLCAALGACNKADDGSSSSIGAYSLFDPIALNPSLCGSPAIPFPNDALFSGFNRPTLKIPNTAGISFVTAANETDGFSTTASAFTDVLGAVDFATAPGAILIMEVNPGAAPRFLTYGTDFTLQPSVAMAQLSGTGPSSGTCTATALTPGAKFLPISDQRSRILIEPLKPLKESTKYIVAVTRTLKSRDGVPTTPGEMFPIVNSDTPVASQTAPVLAQLNPTQLGTLEALRSQLIRPAVTGLKQGYTAVVGGTLNDSDLVIAWSFTTESVTKSLANLNTTPVAVPRTISVAATTLNTHDANAALASYANIYLGTVSLPYFLKNASGSVADPLSTFWGADTSAPDLDPNTKFLGAVPCGAFATGAALPNGNTAAPSASTTICYPRPLKLSDEVVPIIVTVPNASAPNTGGSCGGRATIASTGSSLTCTAPVGGWPVVVFQHGITRNRTDMLALAPTLAAAGFVVVAIDLPLHGITDTSSPFYRNQIFTGTPAAGLITGERTFDLNLADNTTGLPPADGLIDSSGTWFINLSSLLTSRDNLRQGESDVIHLGKSLAGIDVDPNTTTDIDTANAHFVGQSLGAIVGTTVLGIDSTVFGASSLNVPGGGLGKLLDASAAFGPRIAAGLSASPNFVFEGTDNYETFVRFAQHLTDPGDPINYAVAASANHALHVVEVIDDAVVPNNAINTCASPFPSGLTTQAATATGGTALTDTITAIAQASALMKAACPPLVLAANTPLNAITHQDTTVISGFLSGTDPLVRIMGITKTVQMGSAPFATQALTPPVGDVLVEFDPHTAEHGTLLTPVASSNPSPNATFAPATCEEQRQTASYLASGGALLNGPTLPIGGSCP